MTISISPVGAGTVTNNSAPVDQTDTTTEYGGMYEYESSIRGTLLNLQANADAANDWEFGHWEVVFEVTEYSDGESPVYDERTFRYNVNPLVGSIESGNSEFHGHPVPPFDGLFEGSFIFKRSYNPGEGSAVVSRDYVIVRNVRVNAVFHRIHTDGLLTYHANGGVGGPTTQAYFVGVPFALSASVPTRQGYRFLGWSRFSGDTSASFRPSQQFTSIDTSEDFYAVWAFLTGLPIRNRAGTGLLRGANGIILVDA